MLLQQPLPFTVLKHKRAVAKECSPAVVATALTVYGIETDRSVANYRLIEQSKLQQPLPFTVLKPAFFSNNSLISASNCVATALTVYGIETGALPCSLPYSSVMLQQPLPFTVLKLSMNEYRPPRHLLVATALTVYGIETQNLRYYLQRRQRCNSPYRLRY